MTGQQRYERFSTMTSQRSKMPWEDLPQYVRDAWDDQSQINAGIEDVDYADAINHLAKHIHQLNTKWWENLETGERITRNVGEMLMLVVTELAEAMEGHRKGLMDDHLPKRPMVEVELADTVIRIMDISAGLGLDLGWALMEKLEYNKTRADHQIEARKGLHGKKV